MKHLGIITALLPEARCLDPEPVPDQPKQLSETVSILVCGMGQQRAESAANRLIDFGADSLLVLGTCGALSTTLNPGDIVMPENVITDAGIKMQVATQWYNKALKRLTGLTVPIHRQDLLSTDRVVKSTSEKNQLNNNTGAVAVDMESAGIIQVASTRQVPVLVIRAVVDPVSFSLPEFVLRNSDIYGNANPYLLLKSCCLTPTRLVSLYRLWLFHGRAMRTLKRVNERLMLQTDPADIAGFS